MKRLAVLAVLLALAVSGAWIYRNRTRFIQSAPADASGHAHDTTPVAAPGTSVPRGEVVVDPRRQQLIGVRTVTTTHRAVTETIRAAGVVRYAETRLSEINLKLDGWIRQLFVDSTGQPISRGEPLFTFYSPDLVATENEYLLAMRTRDELQASRVPDARERADQLVASAKQRLALWDLPGDEMRLLDERRVASDAVTFRSPVTGVVTDKIAVQGMHVTAGQTLYKVADLSAVWVEADVYEHELPLVRIGGQAAITIDAYPGERFVGRAIYIYPYLDEKTRTNKVRYEFPNARGRLKPGMFANVEIAANAGASLMLPADAVLDSGAEQLVFVAQGDGYFEPRRVTVGRRIGDDVQIVSGLKDGEQVASAAAFFLDSESQLRGSLQGYRETPGTAPGPSSTSPLDIVLRTTPDPPTTGDVRLEAVVRDTAGTPVDNADVAVQFFMPAMPTMNMPAMKSETKLVPAGNGVYRGSGQVLMSGRWEVTVVVSRAGRRLGSRQLPMVTK